MKIRNTIKKMKQGKIVIGERFWGRACSRLGTRNNELKTQLELKDKIIQLMANDILTNYIVNVEDVFAYDEYPGEPMTLEYILNKYENQAKEVEG